MVPAANRVHVSAMVVNEELFGNLQTLMRFS